MEKSFGIPGGLIPENTTNFFEEKTVPSSNFEEEKAFIESEEMSEKLQSCFEAGIDYEPHNEKSKKRFESLPPKNFSFFQKNGQVKSFTEKFLLKQLYKNEFSANKPSDEAKIDEFLGAHMEDGEEIPEGELESNCCVFFYCPFHEKNVFMNNPHQKCASCERNIESKNNVVVLSVIDVLSLILSDKKVIFP